MIECRNSFCIYNEDGENCMFDSITVNELGMCDDCILPTIPDDELEAYKEKTLELFRSYDAE